MKRKVLFFIVAIMAGTVISAYAAEDGAKDKNDSIFQNLSDVINGKYEMEAKPLKKITMFQTMADGIGTVKRGGSL